MMPNPLLLQKDKQPSLHYNKPIGMYSEKEKIADVSWFAASTSPIPQAESKISLSAREKIARKYASRKQEQTKKKVKH